MLKLEKFSDEDRELLLDREVYNLLRLDRVQEGLSHYDRRIAAVAGDSDKHLRLLFWKSQMVLGRDPVEQSIAVWRAYRDATQTGTEDRFEASAMLARELRRANRHVDALKLVNELLEGRRDAWQLLDAAESYIAIENTSEALKVITEAEMQVEKLKESQRKSDRDLYTHLAGRLVVLKDALAAASKTMSAHLKD